MKIAVVSINGKHSADIVRLLASRNPSDEVGIVPGIAQVASTGSEPVAPDVLIFDAPSVAASDLEQLERLSQIYPRLALIVLCEQNSSDFLMQAMRAGVREVLATPFVPDALLGAIHRVEEKRGSHAQTQAKVIAFISCKGGSGATFLATNIGYALSLKNKRVALLDLNLQFGDASLFVTDEKPQATISDIASQIHRLDASFLAASMLDVTPSFSILAAPEDPAHADEVKPEHVDKLIKLARRHFDFVILDVGRSLDLVSVHALDHADIIFPVMQATLPYIRDGKRLLGVFRSLDYRSDKIQIIVNRHEKNGEIKLADVETAFSVKDVRTIPNHYEAAAASVNHGVPILKLVKNSPISKALQDFAQTLAGESDAPSARWTSKLFRRS